MNIKGAIFLAVFLLVFSSFKYCFAYTTLGGSKTILDNNEISPYQRFGSLNIYSEIPGVEIYVDGTLRGRDMVKMDNIQIGSHLIKALGGDRVIYNEIVKVEEGALSTIIISEQGIAPIDATIPTQVIKREYTELMPLRQKPLLGSFNIGIHSQTISTNTGSSINGNGFNFSFKQANPLASNLFFDFSIDYYNTTLNDIVTYPVNLFDVGIGLKQQYYNGAFSFFSGFGLLFGYMAYSAYYSGINISGNGTGPGYYLILGYEYQSFLMALKYSYLSNNSNISVSGYGSVNSTWNFSNVSLGMGFPF